jgi:hypothetical protein
MTGAHTHILGARLNRRRLLFSALALAVSTLPEKTAAQATDFAGFLQSLWPAARDAGVSPRLIMGEPGWLVTGTSTPVERRSARCSSAAASWTDSGAFAAQQMT